MTVKNNETAIYNFTCRPHGYVLLASDTEL